MADEKTYVSSAGWYTLMYPDPWVVTDDDTCTTFCEPAQGVGALQVSVYQAPDPQDPTDLLFEYLSDRGIESEEDIEYYESNSNRIAVTSYVRDDEKFWRVWFIARSVLFLFVTYNCNTQFRDVEFETVDRIVGSITLINP